MIPWLELFSGGEGPRRAMWFASGRIRARAVGTRRCRGGRCGLRMVGSARGRWGERGTEAGTENRSRTREGEEDLDRQNVRGDRRRTFAQRNVRCARTRTLRIPGWLASPLRPARTGRAEPRALVVRAPPPRTRSLYENARVVQRARHDRCAPDAVGRRPATPGCSGGMFTRRRSMTRIPVPCAGPCAERRRVKTRFRSSEGTQ